MFLDHFFRQVWFVLYLPAIITKRIAGFQLDLHNHFESIKFMICGSRVHSLQWLSPVVVVCLSALTKQ